MSSSGLHVRYKWKKFSKSSTLDQRWVGGLKRIAHANCLCNNRSVRAAVNQCAAASRSKVAPFVLERNASSSKACHDNGNR